ncbi:MAG: aspartyl/asparaginyl beta-hydroxylase domain-containing protein [Acidobacteriota bacterium]|nr:aspartyl/asparaginyl beta-hydroxylase domain-containing protein [Acidobacteriota bacterium]MDH3530331.1 aspartyl/asparaginyl beta-hydroxylase domain-containing protein [Acidobacteriota bacterium]
MPKSALAKYSIKIVKRVVPLALLLYFIPKITVVFFLIGLIDVSRNRPLSLGVLNRYFFGNGVLTWLIAPLNLFIDLICIPFRNRGIYSIEDLPDDYRKEINKTIETLKKDPKLISRIREMAKTENRAMVFFRWYGRPVEGSLKVEGLDGDLKFVRTIGVSAFNAGRSTGFHFGPFRTTIRVLYNLNRIDSEDAFIEVGNTRQVWKENPLFIFDDTLMHRSVNESDEMRFCVFADIIRPSYMPAVLRTIVTLTQYAFFKVNFLFYKNWTFLR